MHKVDHLSQEGLHKVSYSMEEVSAALKDVGSLWGHCSPEWPFEKPGEVNRYVGFSKQTPPGCHWACSDSILGSWRCLEVHISLGDHSWRLKISLLSGRCPIILACFTSAIVWFSAHAGRTPKQVTPATQSIFPFGIAAFLPSAWSSSLY